MPLTLYLEFEVGQCLVADEAWHWEQRKWVSESRFYWKQTPAQQEGTQGKVPDRSGYGSLSKAGSIDQLHI